METGLDKSMIEDLVKRGLAEDMGARDLTTDALVPGEAKGRAEVRVKAAGVLAGQEFVEEVFRQLGAEYEAAIADGSVVKPGDIAGRAKGRLRALLFGERTALNALCRLSGIATLTRKFVDAVKGTKARILDTRKTTPIYRALEKYAVRMGGGVNHRLGLSDQVLVKENHIAAAKVSGEAAGFSAAMRLLSARVEPNVTVGIEVQNLSELHIALEAKPAYILCDNFDVETLRMAVQVRDGWPGTAKPELEASGGVNLANVAAIAATGVERISIGALTHSAPALDLSMKIVA